MSQTLKKLLRFRGLMAVLVSRELKARYRGSVLGFFWSLVNPLLLLGVYTFVFGYIFRPAHAGEAQPYGLFLITGLFPWIWVATGLLEGTVSLTANAGLIRKAVFPAEVLPMVAVFANLVHFLFALPIVVAAMGVGRFLGHPVCGWSILLLPAVILLQLVLLSGMALGLSGLNVHFKDTRDLLNNLLTLLFFMTPIIYPLSAIAHYPLLSRIARWANPFTPYNLAYQQTVFHGTWPPAGLWLHMLVLSLGAWGLGCVLFGRLSDSLVEAV